MIVLLLFLTDIIFYSLLQQQFISLLLSYYVIMFFCKSSFMIPGVTAFLYMLSTFVTHGNFGIELIYLIPLTGTAFIIKKFCNYQAWQAALFAALALFFHQEVIRTITQEQAFSLTFYTIIKIIVILLVTISFSLIWQWYGTQGNRLPE